MKLEEIVVGDYVLLQSAPFTKEHALIKSTNPETGKVIVRLSNGQISEIAPEYIIKSFGPL